MKPRNTLLLALAGTALCCMAAGDTVTLTLLPSGAMPKVGGYIPHPITLSPQRPAGLTKAPELANAQYGVLTIGPKESPTRVIVAVQETPGQATRVLIDANGNGDLTDDPAVTMAPPPNTPAGTPPQVYMGGATVQVRYGAKVAPLHLGVYKFTPSSGRPAGMLFCYADYAAQGKLTLGGKTYPIMLADMGTTGDFRPTAGQQRSTCVLMIDRDGDGRYDYRWEQFDAAKPFNIGGTTYELAGISPSGDRLSVKVSAQKVAEQQAPPNLAPGRKALPFQAKLTDGRPVEFPASYKGKVVMLDFWATWCGPCRGEIPGLVKAYAKYHDKGFEVLGISLDQANQGDKLAQFTRENSMTWPQVYDGKYWQAAVAQQYGINSIPHAVLVDGDTGAILADGETLRGGALEPAIQKALAGKK